MNSAVTLLRHHQQPIIMIFSPIMFVLDQVVVKEEPADVHEDTMETLRERLLDDIADELSGSQEDCNGEGKTISFYSSCEKDLFT